MDDSISRQALLESIERISVKGNVLDDDWIYRFIQEFPSEQKVDKDINVPINDIISRQAAIKAICEDGTWLESQGCTEITMCERKQRDADILSELPTIEAEPVRHGRWIIKGDPENGWYKITCSECGEDETAVAPCIGFMPNVKVIWDFCPNCGAKMEE